MKWFLYRRLSTIALFGLLFSSIVNLTILPLVSYFRERLQTYSLRRSMLQ